jgi:hypothetical protein
MKHAALAFAILAAALPAQAGTREVRPLTPQPLLTCDLNGADAEFLSAAAKLQQLQMLVAGIANSRASESQLQLLGKALVEDGQSEQIALAQLAALKQFPISVIRAPEARVLGKKLARLSGVKLDKLLLTTILSIEKQRAAIYQAGSTSSDSKISAFATDRATAVQENLLLASKLAGSALPKTLPAIAEPPVK